MRKIVYGILFSLASIAANAQESDVRVGIHLGTHHTTGKYNDINMGAYVLWKGWTTGTYQNSVRNTSIYVAHTWEVSTPNLPLVESLALTAGAITGYRSSTDSTALGPLIVPSAAFRINPKLTMRWSLMPINGADLDSGGAALHMSLEFPLQ